MASSILEDFTSQLDSDSISSIANQLGVDSDVASKAIGAAIPALLSGLSRAAEDPQKSERLAEVINQHEAHEGGLLDQLTDIFKQFTAPEAASSQQPDPGALLKDILGSRTNQVEKGVGKTSGLSPDLVGQLIKYLAPVMLSVIAKQMSGANVDGQVVNQKLSHQREQMEQGWGKSLGRLFDQDHDGDFDLSDVAEVVIGQIGAAKAS